MSDLTREDRQLMLRAAEDIRALRRQNEVMRAQLDVVEIFRAALLGPRQGGTMGEDIVALMMKRIGESSMGDMGLRGPGAE